MKRSFPRAKQKSIIKKYQRKARFSRNADILVRFFEFLFQDLKLVTNGSTAWNICCSTNFARCRSLLTDKNSLNGVKSSVLGDEDAIQFYSKQDFLAKSFSRHSQPRQC